MIATSWLISVVAGSVLLLRWYWDLLEEKKKHSGRRSFYTSKLFLETLFFVFVIVASIVFVYQSPFAGVFKRSHAFMMSAAFILSALISMGWYSYIQSLDIYEKERVWSQILVFVLACFSLFIVFPVSDWMNNTLHFTLGQSAWMDFWYCVVAIGLVEEVVKILPFLILLKLTKQINEPFDYIRYGSLAALGFAFVENASYMFSAGLELAQGRLLYASVAHMFDTSIICYLLALQHFKRLKWSFGLALLSGLLLASFAHGFYDYWLISPFVRGFEFLTFIFFLLSVYMWSVMKNNLVNISNFQQEEKHIKGVSFKYLIINTFTVVVFFGYCFVFLSSDMSRANLFLEHNLLPALFILTFITLSFGSLRIIPGYLAPVIPDRNILTFFSPFYSLFGDDLDAVISLRHPNGPASELLERLGEHFPIQGKILKVLILNRDSYWYLLKLSTALPIEGFVKDHLLIRSRNRGVFLSRDLSVKVELRLLYEMPKNDKMVIKKEDTVFLALALSKKEVD